MHLCEELTLALTCPDGRAFRDPVVRWVACPAGAFGELWMSGRVQVLPAPNALAVVRDPRSLGSPLLDGPLSTLVGRPPRPMARVISARRFCPEPQVLRALVAAGVVTRGRVRMLGMAPRRHPVADPRPGAEFRAGLGAVLVGRRPPGPGEAEALAVLDALRCAAVVLTAETGGMPGEVATRRIAVLTAGTPAQWLGRATGEAFRALVAARNSATSSTSTVIAAPTFS